MRKKMIGRSVILYLVVFVICICMGCQLGPHESFPLDELQSEAAAKKTGQVKIIVSVDWEGAHLKQENMDAMRSFRRDFPEVTLLHYLNAAYLTKPDANCSEVASTMKSVMRKGDEFGLHIHGWRTLIEAADVDHSTANKWTPSTPEYEFPVGTPCSYDCGHEIPITNYSEDELTQVIAKSIDLLESYGFGTPRSFRSGGWMSNDAVRSACLRNGILSDSSAVPVNLVRDDLWIPGAKEYQLIPMLDALWEGRYNTESQPFIQATSEGAIIQIPDNGALADYMTANEMYEVIVENYRAIENAQDRYVMIGFHQESAKKFLPRLRSLLEWARRYTGADGPLAYAELPIHRELGHLVEN